MTNTPVKTDTTVDKDVNPHNIKPRTRQRLFALSHNRCSFPGCDVVIASIESEILKAAVCHVEAAEPEGERFNPNMDNEQRRSFDNLILLCPTHHTETD